MGEVLKRQTPEPRWRLFSGLAVAWLALLRLVLSVRAVCLALVLAPVLAAVWWYWAGSPVATLRGDDVVSSVAFSPDGRVLAMGSYRYDYSRHQPEGIIILWDVPTRRQTAKWVAHGHFITSLAFDLDGRTLTSVASRQDGRWGKVLGGEQKTWSVTTQKEVGERKEVKATVRFPVISPDNRTTASHGGGGVVVLTDEAGAELSRLRADPLMVNCVAFSPDGTLLATGGGNTQNSGPSPVPGANGDLRFWDVRTGRLLATFNRHWWGPIMDIAFAPDGELVATASLDGTVKLWRVPKP